jgi:parallel beta-helix repeat protein
MKTRGGLARWWMLATLMCSGTFAAENTLVISPGGPDSGLNQAVAKSREMRKAHPSETFTIVLSSGRYELEEPLLLTPADNGLQFAAAKGARPVISGGRLIKNWRRDQKNPRLWRAEIPEAHDGKWYFRQLFVNGKRMVRARTPNSGYYRIDGAVPRENPLKLKFKGNEIKPEWAKREDVEVVAYLAWSDIRMPIRAVNMKEHIATLAGNPRPSNQEQNAEYYVENAPELLDMPGEWYLDKKTGVASLWSEDDGDLNQAEVIAPLLDELVVIRGDAARKAPVKNISFHGIEFSHSDWTLGPEGYADTQAAVASRGDVRAEFAVDCVIENCVFSHLGGYGLDLGRGCSGFRVIGNEMVDLGAGGIRIGEPQKPKNSFEENHSQSITDNHLHALGRVYAPAVGVFILQSGKNRVAHNEINDLYYTAISVGWNWGYQETPCRENIIEFNHLHDIGQKVLSDMGAVYTLGIQRGTVIRNNLIHDVNSFTYGGWGLYTDEGSSDILLENNIVYRCKSAGFHQHYGRDNVLRNNILALNVENQLMRTREEAHNSFTFTNNIVYFDSGNLLGSNWSNDHYVMDYNIYYDKRLGEKQEGLKFSGATLEDWRKRGHDRHSLLENPRFVAPEKGDFRLKPDSPALKLGFKPIDMSSVGVRAVGKRD